MRVLLSTIGSRGDVQPLVALAIELRALGQEVRLCVPPGRSWTTRASSCSCRSSRFATDGLAGLAIAAGLYNASAVTEKATKYVANMQIAVGTGAITATMQGVTSGLPLAVQGTTLTMTPNVSNAALAGIVGSVDWACGTSTHATATAKGLGATTPGTMPGKYAPAECR